MAVGVGVGDEVVRAMHIRRRQRMLFQGDEGRAVVQHIAIPQLLAQDRQHALVQPPHQALLAAPAAPEEEIVAAGAAAGLRAGDERAVEARLYGVKDRLRPAQQELEEAHVPSQPQPQGAAQGARGLRGPVVALLRLQLQPLQGRQQAAGAHPGEDLLVGAGIVSLGGRQTTAADEDRLLRAQIAQEEGARPAAVGDAHAGGLGPHAEVLRAHAQRERKGRPLLGDEAIPRYVPRAAAHLQPQQLPVGHGDAPFAGAARPFDGQRAVLHLLPPSVASSGMPAPAAPQRARGAGRGPGNHSLVRARAQTPPTSAGTGPCNAYTPYTRSRTGRSSSAPLCPRGPSARRRPPPP